MKILIPLSMLIIFISVFFVLLVLTDISNKYMNCFQTKTNKIVCSVSEFGFPFVFGLFLVGVFVLIDVLVIYFLLKTLMIKGSVAYATEPFLFSGGHELYILS